jgi:hypothetical protein
MIQCSHRGLQADMQASATWRYKTPAAGAQQLAADQPWAEDGLMLRL